MSLTGTEPNILETNDVPTVSKAKNVKNPNPRIEKKKKCCLQPKKQHKKSFVRFFVFYKEKTMRKRNDQVSFQNYFCFETGCLKEKEKNIQQENNEPRKQIAYRRGRQDGSHREQRCEFG